MDPWFHRSSPGAADCAQPPLRQRPLAGRRGCSPPGHERWIPGQLAAVGWQGGAGQGWESLGSPDFGFDDSIGSFGLYLVYLIHLIGDDEKAQTAL